MQTFFSASKLGFYNSVVHAKTMPKDCKEIDESLYMFILENQIEKGVISSDENGLPILKKDENAN